ncbi:hypothetical protein ACAN107058_19295 [Paracidovorax anthurii]
MPKVRASSATMGTMRGPRAPSFSSAPSMRTKAMVVLISLPAACSANCAYWSTAGTGTTSQAVSRRGRAPPRAARRARRYCISGLSSAGRWKARPVACASVSGRLKRLRNPIRSASSSFFWLCVVILPCPAVPMP